MNSLTALTDLLDLSPRVELLATGSQPHRALWDTVATALLLPALITRRWPGGVTLVELLEASALALPGAQPTEAAAMAQDTPFGPA